MKLALFDLDHTLLDGDTNILWLDHLAQRGLAEADTIERQQQYMALYAREQLDMAEYMDFHIGLLRRRRISEWQAIVEHFVHSELVPRLAPAALAWALARGRHGARRRRAPAGSAQKIP